MIKKDCTRHCTSSLLTRKDSLLSGEFLDLSWFCYSGSPKHLSCFTCKLLSKTNSKFTNGFNNFKKAVGKIDKHRKSQSHQEASISSRIDCQLVQATELESKCWRKFLWRMADVIALLTTRGLALRGHGSLAHFIMKTFLV